MQQVCHHHSWLRKLQKYLQGEGHDITIEAIGATEGNKVIESAAMMFI